MYDTNAKKRRAPRLARAVLMTSLLALFIAVPALADHSYASRSACSSGSGAAGYAVGWNFGRRPHRAYACDPEVEYERGYQRGHRRGYKVGYRHGFNGRQFCGTAARDFKHESPYFVKGYLEAYGRAYTKGFRRGRAECGSRGRRHRRW